MQDNWQWCNRCMGLAFFGNGALGQCPAGGEHDHGGSGNYALAGIDDEVSGQDGWRWCVACQGLYFIGNGSHGYCPGGGAHREAGSGDYVLLGDGGGQNGWRWCVRCQGMFFSGDGGLGLCPAPGGGPHSTDGSGDYVLTILNTPAAPPPVTSTVIERTGERALIVNWVPTASDAPATDEYDVFESTGPFADRFVGSVDGGTFFLPVGVGATLPPTTRIASPCTQKARTGGRRE